MAANNWREFIASIVPTVLAGPNGERYMGIQALLYDVLSDGLSEAFRLSWFDQPTSSSDSLALGLGNRNLERYPNESNDQYRARLLRAWADWQSAGDETAIEGQYAAAGFVGARVYDQAEWSREPSLDINGNPWWSLFWVFFPAGSHPVTAPGITYGSGHTYGDGSTYGPLGIEGLQQMLRGIVQKWKPSDWRALELVFEISGATYGTGHVFGEPGLTYGGEIAVMGAA